MTTWTLAGCKIQETQLYCRKIRKDLAQSSRGLQTSLAVADLAKHLGGPSKIDTLTRMDLKGLSQVMGTLAQESALAMADSCDVFK